MPQSPLGATATPPGAAGPPRFGAAGGMQAERAMLADFLRYVAVTEAPSEVVLLAQLATINDGAEDVAFAPHWDMRPMAGSGTTLVYRAPIAGIIATFAFESGYDGRIQRLAVMVEAATKGTRQFEKLAQERHLRAQGFQVMWICSQDVVEDATGCRHHIEAALQQMLHSSQTPRELVSPMGRRSGR